MIELLASWFTLTVITIITNSVFRYLIPSLALVSGIYLVTFFTYLFSKLFALPASLVFNMLIIGFFIFLLVKKRLEWETLKQTLYTSFSLLVIWSNLCWYQSLAPEIYWGEKYGEHGILTYLSNYDILPPSDPWCAKNQLRYYYLHYLYWAIITKSFDLNPSVVFNVAVAFTPSVCCV
ncbi:MAG: DUF2298 domain-containing protein, partial [Deltaproteobacteria bacterium]|nr:DUF2298 domain-containing protein [Deltaproteobacteria bacterium]